MLRHYPESAAPYVPGETRNLVFTYDFDSVTAMQAFKASWCRIEPGSISGNAAAIRMYFVAVRS
ncbi:formate dehydrogenase-O, major subunit [Methylocaldum marinum]|uniref:Formate dehydrogenase-O, major subunit n=1 Tax=Methylocaldum marinum TaxID=1432792 RepID=A0A250KYS7_9GAMM|nr:hypothetical protein [Methylocaldum marinum]BBA36838.1 formate dehydrogenase-O, major subunit [Methylocaldum marinum]